ncbi:MAG: hypothetical protein ACTSR8_20865 [Promethearchaeota archaeon]
MIGICPKALRRWGKTGKNNLLKIIGGHRRFQINEIQKLDS